MINLSVQETVYSDIIAAMINNRPWAMPAGTFYGVQGVAVPHTPKPTVLRVETDVINEILEIQIATTSPHSIGVDVRRNQKTLTVVPQSSTFTVGLQLGIGANIVTVFSRSNPADSTSLIIRTNPILTLFEAFARVLYANSLGIIRQEQASIQSDQATRLLEPFIDFPHLLPDIQALQTISARLIARGLIHNVGTDSGVSDLLAALTLSTPIYKNIDKDTFELYPALDPWVTTASQFGGKEAHVWLSNIEVAGWLAFIKYVSNQPDLFGLRTIREDLIAIDYQTQLQRHQFDFDASGANFLNSLSAKQCFKSITVFITAAAHELMLICAAAYTFDLVVDVDHQIGHFRSFFDRDIPFDSDLIFDADPEDPYTDGWVGLSLTGRFEQDFPTLHCLDTFVVPSTAYTGPLCCYPSFYTQTIANSRYDFPEIDVPITVSGYSEQANAFVLESPDTSWWSVTAGPNGELVATLGSPTGPTHWKVTRPDAVEASFRITNAGVLQVVSPPDPSEIVLNDSLFISCATTARIWKVTVSNADEAATKLVF